MSKGADPLSLAQALLEGLGAGAEPERLAELFSTDVRFEVPGDIGALPWLGRQEGRGAVLNFFRGTRTLTKLHRFDVQAILADHLRAIVVGDLISEVTATGRRIESPFALLMTVTDGRISRFQMLEDSFAVSRAARP